MKKLSNKKKSFFDFVLGEGNYHQNSNKYLTVHKQKVSNDKIIIRTNNIAYVKGNPVLVVGKNKAVYLKTFNIFDAIIEGFICKAVVLDRKYFKPYTFQSDFEEFCFDREETFDDLLKVAEEQENYKNEEGDIVTMGIKY